MFQSVTVLHQRSLWALPRYEFVLEIMCYLKKSSLARVGDMTFFFYIKCFIGLFCPHGGHLATV